MTPRPAMLLATLLLATSPSAAQEFSWETDLNAARATAKEESRPLLVVFR